MADIIALMSVFLGAVVVGAWVYLLAARGRFWRFRDLLPMGTSEAARRIAVVIPARDEAEGIGRTVRSLLTQQFAGALQLVIIDDHSADDTAAVAHAAAVDAGAANRLTIVASGPLAPGWTGKLWAVAQGLEQAGQFAPDYILLTDADIEHAPDSVASLVAQAERGNYDLTSVMVRLDAEHAAESLLIPAFVFFFFKLYPPRWVADRRAHTAGAAGGCMLVRPEALDRIGGIAAIRGELIDDCALAAAIKHSGGRIWLGLSRETHSTRVYRSLGEIRNIVARTAYTQLRYSPVMLAGTVAGMFVLYLAGPGLALGGARIVRVLGITAWVLMSAAFVPALRFYDKPIWMAPLLPAAAAFYVEATVASAVRYYSGRGGQWKGRAQAASANRDAK